MVKTRLLMLTLFAALLSACDGGPKQPPDLVKSQRQAMEKAKGVEQTLQQSAGERREREDKEK